MYTLILQPDRTFEILVDGESERKGSITDEFEILAPKTIADPDQSKPDDWVDEAMMDDPEDNKPEGTRRRSQQHSRSTTVDRPACARRRRGVLVCVAARAAWMASSLLSS